MLGDVVAKTGDGGRDVARALGPFRIGRETIAAVDADVAQAREILGDVRRRAAAAADEPAAVEDDDRGHGSAGRRARV